MLPIIETNRCILKSVSLDNAKDMYEYTKQDKVVEFMTFDIDKDINETKKFIEDRFINRYESGICKDFGITYKENNKFIGTAGFAKIVGKVAILGYCLNPDYWGQGIATEVVNKIIKFGFEELKLDKIEAMYYDGNDKSENVMKRCNMKYIGSEEREVKLRGKMTNGIIHKYELVKEDYYN